MRRSTGLHANQAGWQRFEELRHLPPTKLFSDRDVLGRVNAVDLEHVLRDVQTDRGNLHVDGSPHVIRLNEPLYGTSMRERAPSTTSDSAIASTFATGLLRLRFCCKTRREIACTQH